jgi:hypothetical protein
VGDGRVELVARLDEVVALAVDAADEVAAAPCRVRDEPDAALRRADLAADRVARAARIATEAEGSDEGVDVSVGP